jgi:hypothetical protein
VHAVDVQSVPRSRTARRCLDRAGPSPQVDASPVKFRRFVARAVERSVEHGALHVVDFCGSAARSLERAAGLPTGRGSCSHPPREHHHGHVSGSHHALAMDNVARRVGRPTRVERQVRSRHERLVDEASARPGTAEVLQPVPAQRLRTNATASAARSSNSRRPPAEGVQREAKSREVRSFERRLRGIDASISAKSRPPVRRAPAHRCAPAARASALRREAAACRNPRRYFGSSRTAPIRSSNASSNDSRKTT